MSNAINFESTEQGLRVIPIYREESKQFFVDADRVPPWHVTLDGYPLLTGAMKIGALYDLFGISQSENLLETGVFDVTDALSPNIALESLYIEERHPNGMTKVQRYDLQDQHGNPLPTASGGASMNYRQVEVNFSTASLVAGNGDVRLDLHVAGHVNLELGHCELVASGVQATPDQGVEYEVLGYTLAAFRINHNRAPRPLSDALAGGHPSVPDAGLAAEINSIPADAKPVAWSDLIGETNLSKLDQYLAQLTLAVGLSIPSSFVFESPSEADTEELRYRLVSYFAARWLDDNVNIVLGREGERSFRQYLKNWLANAAPAGEREEPAPPRESISAFSGLEYNEGWNAKGIQITSHEVEGAASNLTITVGDEPAQPGGANHVYRIDGFVGKFENGDHQVGLDVLFQNGPIPSHGNNGVTIEALLAVIAHRLEGFQAGPFASQDNEDALLGVKNALEALQRRTRNRIARQVEGTYQA